MSGGDRMLHNGYGEIYSRCIKSLESCADVRAVIEVGILKGSGLAIWCDLFPKSRIVGLDIDLSHFEENLEDLERRGAFKGNYPIVREFDQLNPDVESISQALEGQKVSLVIDDGLHSEEAIVNTWNAINSFLAQKFVYVVEDVSSIPEPFNRLPRGVDIKQHEGIIVLSCGMPVFS